MLAPITNSDLTILASALTFGFVSSLHCIGMCGPLACQGKNSPKLHGLYQIGRLLSYQILGLLLYTLSKTMFGQITKVAQSYVMYVLMALYLYIGIMLILGKHQKGFLGGFFGKMYQRFFKSLIQKTNKNVRFFLLGLASGLLPCGLLHTFLLGVIPLKSYTLASLYIGSFWLATSPVLVMSGVTFSLLKSKLKFNSSYLIGGTYILMGLYIVYTRYALTMSTGGHHCH